MAKRGLKIPEGIDKDEFLREIAVYRESHPYGWSSHQVQKNLDARSIHRKLLRISRATWLTQNKINMAAKALGVPFVHRFSKEAAKLRKKKTLEDICGKLRKIHAKDGKLHLLEPNEVKKEHPSLYQRCVQNGGYAKLLNELFGEGSYDRSVRNPNFHLLDKKKTLDYAVDSVLNVLKTHKRYVSAIQMSHEYPDAFYASLRALRLNSRKSRKKISYSDFFEKFCLPALGSDDATKLKFIPPKQIDMERMGYVGELFTYASLYLEHENITLLPGFPRLISGEYPLMRYPMRAPFNISKRTGFVAEETHPDVTILIGNNALFVETKAGLYFWRDAKDMTAKYHETKSKPLRPADRSDKSKVIWAGVHLHFPLDGINDENMRHLSEYSKKHSRPMRVFRPDYFDGFFTDKPTLGSYYTEFITDPLSFVRTEGNIQRLEKRVLATAPSAVQEAALDFEASLRT